MGSVYWCLLGEESSEGVEAVRSNKEKKRKMYTAVGRVGGWMGVLGEQPSAEQVLWMYFSDMRGKRSVEKQHINPNWRLGSGAST